LFTVILINVLFIRLLHNECTRNSLLKYTQISQDNFSKTFSFNLSLYSLNYNEACNEFAMLISRHSAKATQTSTLA